METEVTHKKRRGGRISKAEQERIRQEHIEAGWGGAREGCGRKSKRSVDGEKLSATIAFCVTPTTKKKIQELKKRGIDPYAPMVEAVEQMCVSLGVEIDD